MILFKATQVGVGQGYDDLGPSLDNSGIAYERLRDNIYLVNIKGVVPHLTVELGEREALVKFMGVPVAAAEVIRDERNRVIGFGRPTHRASQVDEVAKRLEIEKTTEIPIAGTVYGVVTQPRKDTFLSTFGPDAYGLFMSQFRFDKEFLRTTALIKSEIMQTMRREDLTEEEKQKLVLKNWNLLNAYIRKKVEEKREPIGELVKQKVFAKGSRHYFLRNNPDRITKGVDRAVIYTGGDRMIMSGTPAYYKLRRFVAKVNKEDEELKRPLTVQEALQTLNKSDLWVIGNAIGEARTQEEINKKFSYFLSIASAYEEYYRSIRNGEDKEVALQNLAEKLEKKVKDFKGLDESEDENIKQELLLYSLKEQAYRQGPSISDEELKKEIERILAGYEERRKAREQVKEGVQEVVEEVSQEQENYKVLTPEEEFQAIAELNEEDEDIFNDLSVDMEEMLEVAQKQTIRKPKI